MRDLTLRRCRRTLRRANRATCDYYSEHARGDCFRPSQGSAPDIFPLFGRQVRAVGVCNYNAGQVEEMHGLLAKRGIPLASNQVRAPRTMRVS